MNTKLEARNLLETVARFFGEAPVFGEMADLGLVLAGGAVTSTFTRQPVKDLDFYVEDLTKIPEATVYLKRFFDEEPYESPNCITFKRKKGNRVWTAQLITRFHGEPSDIFKEFDFTITTGAYRFKTQEFVFGDRYLVDLASRRLVYMGASNYPICALWRTKKYQDRGYTLSGATMLHIAMSIVRLKISTYGELKQQLLGIDTLLLRGLLEEYEDGDPFNHFEFLEKAMSILTADTVEIEE